MKRGQQQREQKPPVPGSCISLSSTRRRGSYTVDPNGRSDVPETAGIHDVNIVTISRKPWHPGLIFPIHGKSDGEKK